MRKKKCFPSHARGGDQAGAACPGGRGGDSQEDARAVRGATAGKLLPPGLQNLRGPRGAAALQGVLLQGSKNFFFSRIL